MKKVIIGVLVFFILIGGIVIVVNKNFDKEKKNNSVVVTTDNKVLHYYYGNYLFDIEVLEERLDVTRYTIVQCIKAPCNPIKDKMFSVNIKKEYEELLTRIFSDEEKEKTIYYDKLSTDDYNILLAIIGEKDFKNNDKYTILSNVDSYDSNYVERGYYIEENEDGKTLVTIAMGERNTGGYSIKITDVIIKNGDVLIYTKESSPELGMSVTMAFTYPIAQIEFNFKPNNIEVQEIDTFTKYDLLIE